jgi:biotin synthase
MKKNILFILNNLTDQKKPHKEDIVELLKLGHHDAEELLYKKAYEIKKEYVGQKVYFRGLIEYSNICAKDCFYCGLRSSNNKIERYQMTDEEVLSAVDFAWKNKYASIVLQSGEITSSEFVDKIDHLIKTIKKNTNGEIGITLSCGEQSKETYKRWFDSGAHRYLLRIETSNPDLYYKIHPHNDKHSLDVRLKSLGYLKELGYQVGSGIMVGLPYQKLEDIADDILFLKDIDVDMIGLGPYIEHSATPLYEKKDLLMSKEDRFDLALKTIAILRIIMKDINIASATALQSIDDEGREKALMAGANVIMPNLTPTKYREEYLLYENKPCVGETADQCKGCLQRRISKYGESIGLGEWGDSKHYKKRTSKKNKKN